MRGSPVSGCGGALAWPLANLPAATRWGTSGFDPVPEALDPAARWYAPWRYGVWTDAKNTPDE